MKFLPALAIALLGFSAVTSYGEDPVKIVANAVPNLASKQTVIQITFMEKENGDWFAARVLDPTQGEPYQPTSYLLTESGGPAVTFTIQPPSGTFLQGNVKLSTILPLDENKDYDLKIIAGKLVFKVGTGNNTTIVQNSETTLTIKGKQVADSNARVTSRSNSGSSIALLGGTPGGVGTAKLVLDESHFAGSQWVGLRIEGSADFTLSSQDRSNYFNSIAGELSAYHVFPHVFDRQVELSIHEKIQSDQTFKLVNNLAGAKFAVRPRDPFTAWLGRVFVSDNDRESALVFVGYDYAKNMSGSGSASAVAASTGIDTRKGSHQVTALLRLRIPIRRDQDLSFIPALGGRYDIDLESDIKGFYDSSAGRILDQSRISIAFTKADSTDFKPALLLSWERGKEGPTYQQISALLAGLRLNF